MIEPLPYRKVDAEPVTWFMANVTPDGWTGVQHSRRMGERLDPDEVLEFGKLVSELIKLCPDFGVLMKYFRKHGKQTRCEGMDPTLAFMVDKPKMTYMVETTGPNFWVEAYRKDDNT